MESKEKQSVVKEPAQNVKRGVTQVQPQALDCEEAVIGGLLVEPSVFFDVASILKCDYFYDEKNRLIFEAMSKLWADHKPIDYISVSEQLKADGNLKKVGGRMRLVELTDSVSSAVNIESYATIVADKYIAREIIRVTSEIQEKAFDPHADIKDVLKETTDKVFDVTQTNVQQEAVKVGDITKEVIKKIEEAGNNNGNYTGVPSGFKKLDDIIYGWQPGTLNVIAARPAMGKTAFALSMARNMAVDNGRKVLFFSLEMSSNELINRLLVNVSEIPGENLKKGNLAEWQWDCLYKKANLLRNSKIFIDDTPGLSIFELCSKARKLQRTENIDCVMIDYLQLVNANIKTGSREQEVSFVSRSLKALAKELKIPVIALAQLNRGVESRQNEDKRPQLSDLRESGAIEQDADVVIMLHRPEYYKITQIGDKDVRGLAMVIIAKHRSGSIDDIWVQFRKEIIKFQDIDPSTPQESYDSVFSEEKGSEPFGITSIQPDDNEPF